MQSNEKFEQLIYESGITLIDRAVEGYAGLLVRKKGLAFAFVDPKASRRARAGILAEEYAHYLTSSGDSVRIHCTSSIVGRIEERAIRKAISLAMTPEELGAALKAGVRNWYELSDYLDYPEWFVQKAVRIWRCQYGFRYRYDNCIIFLDTLSLINNMVQENTGERYA